MYAIVGITGRVGSAVGENLLAQGEQIRAIVRDSQGAARSRDRGAEVAVANVHDSNALVSAFEGIDGVFLMIPPNFAPDPGVTVESIQKFRLETLAVQCTNREIGQMLRTGTYHHVSQREIASDKRISQHLSGRLYPTSRKGGYLAANSRLERTLCSAKTGTCLA
jgi:predicted dinucleotide-binding enzyme